MLKRNKDLIRAYMYTRRHEGPSLLQFYPYILGGRIDFSTQQTSQLIRYGGC